MTNQTTPIVQQAVARDVDNVVETGTIPIVFVPGVMGSRLDFPDLEEQWDPNSDWAMSHWLTNWAETSRRELALDNEAVVMDTHDDLTQAQRNRGWAGVAWAFYGEFVQDLDAQSFGRYQTPVYVIGYDWRQDNRDSGAAVATRIREVLDLEGADRFILISHSMGGLVTRACLKESDNSDISDKLLGVIHIAQPVNGGLVMVRRMFTGAIAAQDGGYGLTTVLGNTRKKFQTIMSAVPGPVQLLATPNYRDPNGRWWYEYATFEEPTVRRFWEGNAWDLYLRAASPPGLLAPATEDYALEAVPRREFTARVREAKAYHDWIGLWKHARTWTINSTGLTVDMRMFFNLPPVTFHDGWFRDTATRADGTEVTIDDPNPPNRGNVMRRRAESDSTVPISSAEALFPGQQHPVEIGADYDTKKQFRISGAAHDAICHDVNCELVLFDIMRHLLGT